VNVRVVFDSFFGNTEQVARTIGAELETAAHVRVMRVEESDAARLDGVDLLVVGSPTRAFRPSPKTQAFLRVVARGALEGVRVAAFDTRIAVAEVNSPILPPLVRVFGYAAEPIARRLERAGGIPAGPPAGFLVEGTEGPLRDGELRRARRWARALVTTSDEGASAGASVGAGERTEPGASEHASGAGAEDDTAAASMEQAAREPEPTR
jgi:flavodoxin